MSYKINPSVISGGAQGNVSGSDKAKLDNYPGFNNTDPAFQFSPAKTFTLKQVATESYALNSNGPVAWGFNGNNHISQTSNTASSNTIINLPILKKYAGANLVSIKIYYSIGGVNRAPAIYPSSAIKERLLASTTDNGTISNTLSFSPGYGVGTVGTMTNGLMTTSPITVIDENKIYFIQLAGESGANSIVTPNNLISHIEINLSNITNVYQLR